MFLAHTALEVFPTIHRTYSKVADVVGEGDAVESFRDVMRKAKEGMGLAVGDVSDTVHDDVLLSLDDTIIAQMVSFVKLRLC